LPVYLLRLLVLSPAAGHLMRQLGHCRDLNALAHSNSKQESLATVLLSWWPYGEPLLNTRA
jgi:hypothetical protein